MDDGAGNTLLVEKWLTETNLVILGFNALVMISFVYAEEQIMRLNRPESMRQVDYFKKLIDELASKVEEGAGVVVEAGTKIAAYSVLVWKEGERPEVAPDFWQEVSMTRGKTARTKVINYLVDAAPPRIQRIVTEVKNQIVSTVSCLTDIEYLDTLPEKERWGPLHNPTFEEVYSHINSIGIHAYHQKWMNHLSKMAELDRAAAAQKILDDKQKEIEARAASRGISVDELKRAELQEAQERVARHAAARWADYMSTGTPVVEDWTDDGLIYIRDGKRLIRLTDINCERVRACMVR